MCLSVTQKVLSLSMYWQQTSVVLSGATHAARASLLHGSLSGHSTATLTPVIVCVSFLMVAVTQLCHALYTQTVVRTLDLGTCNCFEIAPCDSPDLFKSITCSFRSMLSSVDFPHCSVCSWVWWLYETRPIKMDPEKSPAIIRIAQKKLKGHDTENISFTQLPIIS